ncbi:MAG TPA: ATP-binding protein [Verrucomicrobiae bacterium]|nr:ATP-binding protein [Verrucomicrobiae bacterium]
MVELNQAGKTMMDAFLAHEARERIFNTKVGCALVVTLMPAGALLDFFVYPDELRPFFILRMVCAACAGLIWALLFTDLGRRHSKLLGEIVPMLPAIFIAGMIAIKDGFASPYYAGLNLVLLAVGAVLQWTFLESIVAVSIVLLFYIAAGIANGVYPKASVLFNNFYFVALMDIIVVVGTYFQSRQRFREFSLRFELDKSKGELEENNKKLVELDRLKGRFFANVSHEMRTPLTLLIAPLESLMKRAESALDSSSRELLETMQSNSMRLLKLINDLLDLVRLESGRMDIKSDPLQIKDFFKGLSSAIKQVAAEKNVQVQTHVDELLDSMLTDRDKLEKILLNLLFNAIKFTPSGGRIDLKAEKKDDRILLIVSDTGIGIAEKSLPFVFDRFWQADNSSRRKYQGVGIGLALVKELSEMMGGGVSVTSVEGQGTTFTVHLPFKSAPLPAPVETDTAVPAPLAAKGADSDEWLGNLYRRAEFFATTGTRRPAPAPSAPAAISGRKPVALIADDEPDMQHFLRTELERDYDLIEATDGVQALEKAELFLPDIVLLDMMMPEMDGLDVCKELRAREATAGIPVILLTARADEETKFDALQMGANDFLAKPFSATELHARIKNLVDSHDYQRKLSKQNQALTSAIEQIKDTETQLVQSEKLASLGRLSAGIIHEINNPLNFATTGVFALRNKTKNLPVAEKAEMEEILNDVDEGLKRVRNIVSDLRIFTHPESGPSESVDVAETVNASLRFLSSEWKGNVRIENNIAPGQVAQANRNKLVHILVNLLQNSLDAMSAKKFEGEEPTIWIEGRVADGKSIIVVRDNGTGIEQKHMAKIFDPFFTTKDVGEGMGLGLSICHRIIRGYGGHVTVKSEPGRFCEFTVDFPEKARKVRAENPAEIPPVPAREAGVAPA